MGHNLTVNLAPLSGWQLPASAVPRPNRLLQSEAWKVDRCQLSLRSNFRQQVGGFVWNMRSRETASRMSHP